MTREIQTTILPSGIEWPTLRNHIQCLAHVIWLALGTIMSSLGVQGCTKSWAAPEHDLQFEGNESTDIGKSQRLWKEGNSQINNVSTMRPGLAKIIEKVHNSTYFESAETDLHIAENVCCIDYSDTWSSKRVHWLSNSQSRNCSPTIYDCENRVEFDAGVAWASLPIMRIHMQMA